VLPCLDSLRHAAVSASPGTAPWESLFLRVQGALMVHARGPGPLVVEL